MTVSRELGTAIRMSAAFWIVVGVFYPLAMTLLGQVLFPIQANGNLLAGNGAPTTEVGNAAGSALIGQAFASERYFNSRPSTSNYSSFTTAERDPENVGQTTGVSGASNLAPSNPDLTKRVTEAVQQWREAGIQPTADLVYTSGSSLDPHISLQAARNQIARIARARTLSSEQLSQLIDRFTEGRFLGIFGEPGVNVLRLNLALEQLREP